jgi:hypothetical protein
VVDDVLQTTFFDSDSDAATAGSSLIDTGFWNRGGRAAAGGTGRLLVLESSVRIVRDGDDLPGVVVAVNVDVGLVIDEHDQVRRPGPDHPRGGDPLTGLPTRSMMEAAFALTPPGGATVVAIDLDRFRLVNQALGSSAPTRSSGGGRTHRGRGRRPVGRRPHRR